MLSRTGRALHFALRPSHGRRFPALVQPTRSFRTSWVTRDHRHTPITTTLINAKHAKGLTFEQIGKDMGRGEVWVASVFYRQARCDETEGRKLMEILGVPQNDPGFLRGLMDFPMKAQGYEEIASDPLIYRLHEITKVYGESLKAVIHEKFGDGIMSAVDFTIQVSRVPDPKGDRVKLEYEGKFLSYKKW